MAAAKQLSIREWLSVEDGKLFFRGNAVGWVHINAKTNTWAIGTRVGRCKFTAYGDNESEALDGIAKLMSETRDED